MDNTENQIEGSPLDQLNAHDMWKATGDAVLARATHEESIVIQSMMQTAVSGNYSIRFEWRLSDKTTERLERKGFKVSREKVYERRLNDFIETTDVCWRNSSIIVS